MKAKNPQKLITTVKRKSHSFENFLPLGCAHTSTGNRLKNYLMSTSVYGLAVTSLPRYCHAR